MRYKVINIGNIYAAPVSSAFLKLLVLTRLSNLHYFLNCCLSHFRFKTLWLADFYQANLSFVMEL